VVRVLVVWRNAAAAERRTGEWLVPPLGMSVQHTFVGSPLSGGHSFAAVVVPSDVPIDAEALEWLSGVRGRLTPGGLWVDGGTVSCPDRGVR
jgi:hypothetical protein